jgi:hypothetical protein
VLLNTVRFASHRRHENYDAVCGVHPSEGNADDTRALILRDREAVREQRRWAGVMADTAVPPSEQVIAV